MVTCGKEQRDCAVDFYERYDFSPTVVTHEFGYPSEPSLKAWCRDRERERLTGEPSVRCAATPLHGRAKTRGGRRLPFARTLHDVHDATSGLFEKQTLLTAWIDEFAPGRRKLRHGLVLEELKREVAAPETADARPVWGSRP